MKSKKKRHSDNNKRGIFTICAIICIVFGTELVLFVAQPMSDIDIRYLGGHVLLNEIEENSSYPYRVQFEFSITNTGINTINNLRAHVIVKGKNNKIEFEDFVHITPILEKDETIYEEIIIGFLSSNTQLKIYISFNWNFLNSKQLYHTWQV